MLLNANELEPQTNADIELEPQTNADIELEARFLAAVLDSKKFSSVIDRQYLPYMFLDDCNKTLAEKIINHWQKLDGPASLETLDKYLNNKFRKSEELVILKRHREALIKAFKYRQPFITELFDLATAYISKNMQTRAENLYITGESKKSAELFDDINNFNITQFDPDIIKIDNFMAIELPSLRPYLGAWLKEQSGTLVYGWRGSGKTWFIDCCIRGITKGKGFGPWPCHNSVPCMIIDAELPAADRQARNHDLKICDNNLLHLINVDHFTQKYPSLPRASLLNPKWCQWVMQMIERFGIKILVLDNESALTNGDKYDENNASDFRRYIGQFILNLRFMDVGTILVHHSNKKLQQSGTAARERFMSNSIAIKQVKAGENSFAFEYEFEKNRVNIDSQNDVRPGVFRAFKVNDLLKFEHTHNIGQRRRSEIIELLGFGDMNQKQIASELNIGQATVSRQKSEGLKNGLFELNAGGEIIGLSEKGREYVEKHS